MSLMFRPAGIPHQDEIARAVLRFSTSSCVRLESAACRMFRKARSGMRGCTRRPLFWLAMQLFRETFAVVQADPLCVESC